MKPLTNEEYRKLLFTLGHFDGLQAVIRDYQMEPQLVAMNKAELFKHILTKVKEGKTEVGRLSASVERLEAACMAGSHNRVPESSAYGPLVNRLRDEMRAFDGWTISLLETDMTLLSMIQNPETAGLRVRGLQKSFAELWASRAADRFKSAKGFPQVFDVETRFFR